MLKKFFYSFNYCFKRFENRFINILKIFDKLTCHFFREKKSLESTTFKKKKKNINQPKARDLFLNPSAWLFLKKKNF